MNRDENAKVQRNDNLSGKSISVRSDQSDTEKSSSIVRGKSAKANAKTNKKEVISFDLESRQGVESYIKKSTADTMQLHADAIANLDEIYEIAKASNNLAEMAKAENAKRQVAKDQGQLLTQMIKSFELFSELNKPTENDPVYTPVRFTIETTPPKSSIVEKKFFIDEDDVQPGQNV